MAFDISNVDSAIDEQLTSTQVQALVMMERIGGSISLVSVMFIFVAYGLVRRVRNVQNSFIVFASISNIGASIASIIAYDGLKAGEATALCQAQSFLFEMFMQSDPWWSLAMAINVLLVFYFHTSPDSFRRRWWIYCLICYGGPFTIALSLLLVRSPKHGLVYGGATIWCWVDREWDFIRIYTYYMLIWICIVGSILCYVLVGYHVFRSRNQLRSFSTSRNAKNKYLDNNQLDPTKSGCYGTVTTEVQITHSPASTAVASSSESKSTPHPGSNAAQAPFEQVEAAASITGETIQSSNPHAASPVNQFSSTITSSGPQIPSVPTQYTVRSFFEGLKSLMAKFTVGDPVKRAYLRTSFLFGLSVLVTWIPSSMNRIHGWIDGGSPWHYHVATAAVLPLQGLWNAIIFFVTSWPALRTGVRELMHGSAFGAVDRRRGEEAGVGVGVGVGERESPAGRRDQMGLDGRCDTYIDDGDSATMGSHGGHGSDVELRRMSNVGGKSSSSSL